jgi:cytochrome c oxidase subunit III
VSTQGIAAEHHGTSHSPYAEPKQRDAALTLAMWVFLGSETMLFAGLFGLYAGYRAGFTEMFAEAGSHNEEWIGSLNTFILIISSFFAAWAIHMTRHGKRMATLVSLALVILLGFAFLGFKSLEYSHHLQEGIAPGSYYTFEELPGPGARIFFTLYYFMTGLHALHVIAGLAFMGFLFVRVYRRRISAEHHVELELGGLYWHLIDVVWIFLWPLLYLIP